MLLATRTRALPRLDREVAPVGFLAAGALAVGLVAVITGLQVTIAALDESVYKFAAVQHANDFPMGVFHEHTSRGVARLYSFVSSPLFRAFDGDVAVRLARALNGVFFASTAIPVALIARRVTRSQWSASAAGVLSVAVPWLTLATIMFSESLAYLLFACAALAIVRAFEAPSWKRDLAVVALLAALLFTRVQFVVLALAWLGLVFWWERRAAIRRFPVTSIGVGLLAVGVLGLVVVGLLSGRFRDLAGPYTDIAYRDSVPGNFGLGLLWEAEMLALGVGLLPAILAAAWLRGALARRDDADSYRVAVIAVTLIGVLFAGTVWAQGGFLDFRSEERYFIYAVPFLWIGAVAALERRELPARWVVVAGLALSFVLFTVPIAVQSTGEQAFLGPVSMSASHLLPRLERDFNDWTGLAGVISGRDLLGLVCGLLVAGAAFAWKRGPRARWLAVVPALALQLFVGYYSFSAVYGKLPDIGGLTFDVKFSDLGWVDRATPGGDGVFLLDNQAEGREGGQRNTTFWNDEVSFVYQLGPLHPPSPGFPVFTLPTTTTDVDPQLQLASPLSEYAVSAADSPLWQVAGESVRRSPDNSLDLIRTAKPARATWIANGVELDGQITRGVDLSAAGGYRVTLDLFGPSDQQPGRLQVRLGDQKREFVARRLGDERKLTFDLCGETGVVTGRIDVVEAADLGGNRFSGGRLHGVHLDPC